MKQFRLEKNVPDVYVTESRDFQLLLRLYTCILDGLIYEVDTTQSVTDTRHIKDTILPLLQTKLGFFSDLEIDSKSLRLILESIPLIIKYKGSLLGIKYVMNLYMKIMNVRGSILISSSDYITGTTLDHSIQIGSDVTFTNIPLLNSLLELVLPTGFSQQYYYFSSLDNAITYLENTDGITFLGKMIAAADSKLRNSYNEYTLIDPDVEMNVPSDESQNILTVKNRLFGSVGISELTGSTDVIPQFSTSNTYSVGDVVSYTENSETHYYQCIVDVVTPGTWNSANWQQLTYYI